MESFSIMDGAMAHAVLGSLKSFNAPIAPWIVPLYPYKGAAGLAGPLLIAYTRPPKGSPGWEDLRRAGNAYPLRLHLSVMTSAFTLEALADHLRNFMIFCDGNGETLGLRIGDCRVVACLPDIFLPSQWEALTAPLEEWQVTNRSGKILSLPLAESRKQMTGQASALRLTDEQVGRLIEASEPDGLLHYLGMAPDLASEKLTQSRHEVAVRCLRHWRASGSTNRAALVEFARQVFMCDTAIGNDDARMKLLLNEAIAATR